ncbi:MBL fold metallo-hydrolase [Chloroflexota bacterium]
MIEIRPGIHQLKIPIPDNPLEYTNSYLVQGDGECLLIDPGMKNDAAFDVLQRETMRVDGRADKSPRDSIIYYRRT